jgi:hypothetical protein
MAITLDRQALGRGIATFVGIAIPCGLLIALDGSSGSGGSGGAKQESVLWVIAALLIFLVAPIVAGVVAGAAQRSPFVHGGLAVAVPAGVFLVVRAFIGVARGDLSGSEVASFLLYLAIVVGLGMLGGYMGFRRRQRLA